MVVSAKKQLIYLDTNIVIDFTCKREPFFKPAQKIFELNEKDRLRISVGTIMFPTFFYLTSKLLSKETQIKFSKFLRENARVIPLTEDSIAWAETSNFSDLEDAIQNHIAESNGCTTIITRNTKDFKKSNLAVLTPEEFLATQEV